MTDTDNDSEYISKGPCDECGSSDACASYTDGHTYCFSCEAYTSGDEGEGKIRASAHLAKGTLVEGEAQDLRARRITQETARKWGYEVGNYNGKPVQIANYRADDGGPVVAQKLRFKDKATMPWMGNQKAASTLYGKWLWSSTGGRMVVVTEGELDALSVSQAFGNKWPVVSVSRGARGATKDVKASIDWLCRFERVVFAFDMDEEGQAAAEKCARLLPPGKAFIAQLSMKDPSDLLVAGKVKEITHACHHAREYRPDGIVSVGDVKAEALTPKEMGFRWFIEQMSEDSYGVHPGNLVTIGAGTGVGKTDFLAEQIAFQIMEQEEKVGTIFLETPPPDLLQIVAGKTINLPLSVPDGGWTQEDLERGIDSLDCGRLYLYDSWGATDWETIKSTITYMAVAQGCKHVYLDHLTALAALVDDEKKALEVIMAELAGIAQRHGIIIWIVSHLATPDGTPHEEGGRVTIRHFKGSRSIGFWSHIMIGLERDQQADDEFERTITTVRILKYRPYSRCVGNTYRMAYDHDTGRLHPAPPHAEDIDHGFTPHEQCEDF